MSVTSMELTASPSSDAGLGRVVGGMIGIVVAFDSCFWSTTSLPGLSAAVFFAAVVCAIVLNRPLVRLRTSGRVVLLLLFGSVLEAGIETGFANAVLLLALTAALAGETFFTEASSFGGRCLSQFVALVRAPGRMVWLTFAIMRATWTRDMSVVLRIIGVLVLLIPGLLVVLGFGALLATGNAVFGAWAHDGFAWLWRQITFDLNPLRLIGWMIVAIAVLPLLRPVRVAAKWWSWTEQLPRWPDLIPHRAAVINSAVMLIALNVLFAVANLADVLFLWSGCALPAGVTYSGFVHSGVNALTTTVVLSAIVLTSIFQQTLVVAGRRLLKILSGVWIAQNLFLLLSVGLRLKFYTEAYGMTVQRLGVLIFLVLVAAGYALLSVKIARDKSLSWLAGGCVLAVVATLYITQFLNLAGWAADYNVARWERDPARPLDVEYLKRLGPPAWPALARAEKLKQQHGAGDVTQALDLVAVEAAQEEITYPQTRLDQGYWRQFSLRAWWNRPALDLGADNK